jgi:hypothetical protein
MSRISPKILVWSSALVLVMFSGVFAGPRLSNEVEKTVKEIKETNILMGSAGRDGAAMKFDAGQIKSESFTAFRTFRVCVKAF